VWFVNGFANVLPLAWLPLALVMLVVASVRGSRLSLLAGVPLLVWLAFMPPTPEAHLALARTCEQAPLLRVTTANVLMSNERLDELARDVLAQQPDLIVFEELQHDLESMSPALALAYPYRLSTEIPWVTLASRVPLEDGRRLRIASDDRGRDPLVATIRVADQDVTVIAAHLTPTRDAAAFEEHSSQQDLLVREARRIDGPIIALGDFNATMFSPVFTGFLARSGLRTAAEHRLMEPTYRSSWRFGLRLDHVLVRDLDVCAESVFGLTGSDHRGVTADVLGSSRPRDVAAR